MKYKKKEDVKELLGSKTPRFSQNQLAEILEWFDKSSEENTDTQIEEPKQFVTIDQLMLFLEERRFHKRSFSYPTFGDIVKIAEEFKAGTTRVFTKEQILYMLDSWVIEANLKHELKLAFKVFDSENRTFLDVDEIRVIVTSYGEPFDENETLELLRDANVRGDGNVFYEDFVDSMFNLAPELYERETEFLFENPEEDPSQSET